MPVGERPVRSRGGERGRRDHARSSGDGRCAAAARGRPAARARSVSVRCAPSVAEAGRTSLSEPGDRTGASVSFMVVSFE